MNTRRRYLALIAAAYFFSSQATIVCIMSELLSSSGTHTVAWQSGPLRDYVRLAWTPRTHLPTDGDTTSPAEEPRLAPYGSSTPTIDLHRCDHSVAISDTWHFSPLSNRPPPAA